MAITAEEAQFDHTICLEEERKAAEKENLPRIAELRNICVTFREALRFFDGGYDDLTPAEKAEVFEEINNEYKGARQRLKHLLGNPESGGYAEELAKQEEEREKAGR
ncbi:hypothetical protein JW752_01690 [Candidatus Peregrinibacteria bacterium]|nr:hypothetical protein [Candidatus Peregrinibacteria bacterium]